MYYRHFGLSSAPFQFTPSPRMLFRSRSHNEALAALEHALLHPSAGFTVLAGGAGSGKTTLAVVLLSRKFDRSRAVYLANPKVGYIAVMREIMRQLGISENGSQHAMFEALSRHLADLKDDEGVLVLIDEAHNLSDASVEGLASLFTGSSAGMNRLHFALMGQPGLMARLAAPGLKQVHELTRVHFAIKPLSSAEAVRYVDYRLAAYDGSASSVFAAGALDHLLEHAHGVPRQINVLCHNSMLIAHGSDSPQVTLANARAAVNEFEHRSPNWTRPTPKPIPVPARQPAAAPVPAFGTIENRKSHRTLASPICVGVGLLAFVMSAISTLYMANSRWQEVAANGLGDTEVPAIFNDDPNSGGENWNSGGYQVADSTQLAITSAQAAPGHPSVGTAITEVEPGISGVAGRTISGSGAIAPLQSQLVDHESEAPGQRGASGRGFGS